MAGSLSDNQVPVTQEECTGGLNSQWRFTDSSNGYVRILAQHSGKCLDVADRSTADGAEVKQYGCGWGDNQRWRFETLSEGYVRIVAQHSSKCLDVQGGSDAAGARIVQSQCDGSAGQAWKVAAAADPTDPTNPTDPPAPGTADQRLTTSVSSRRAHHVHHGGTRPAAPGRLRCRRNLGRTSQHRRRQGLPRRHVRLVTDGQGHRLHRTARKDRRHGFTWTPTCTTKPDSPSSCTAGSPGAVGKDGATLAHAPDGDLTGGEFTADAAVSLGIPKYTPVGDYAGTLTLTLL